MTGDEDHEEKEVPISAYLYNKKEAYEDEFRKTGHDAREDEVKALIKDIQDHFDAILDRRKKIEGVGILYIQYGKFQDLLHEAFSVYELGFYYSTISLCGTLSERICYDFIDMMEISVDNEKLDQKTKESLYELPFRHLLEFLEKQNKIDQDNSNLLHQIYDKRNQYVHPKRMGNAEFDALWALNTMCKVLEGLLSIFKFYNLKDGKFFVKDEYKK
jgi:hypothetical protein